MNKKIIIGLVGQISSGKGTVAKYIEEKYGAKIYRFSTILRDVLNRLYLEINRANMQDISTLLRKKFGEDLLSKVITEDVKKESNNLIVVDGIRRLADIKYLQDFENFYLIRIVASQENRYKCLIQRQENSDDNKKTYEQFLVEQNNEADAEIPLVMNQAKIEINNDAGFEELYKQIDEILNKLK